jgi:hypothetical protein
MITTINPVPFGLLGDGVSTSVVVQVGVVATSVKLIEAHQALNGVDVTSNIASVTYAGSLVTVNFVAPWTGPITVVLNITPSSPVLIQGAVSHVDGINSTYYASSGTPSGNTVISWVTPKIGQILQIKGSATKTVRVVRFNISGYCSGSSVGIIGVTVARRSTSASGGGPVILVDSPSDPTIDPAATAVATYYTSAPTVGALVDGYQRSDTLVLPGTSGSGQVSAVPLVFDFGFAPGAKSSVLRGVNDYLTVTLSGVLPSVSYIAFWLEWIEEQE